MYNKKAINITVKTALTCMFSLGLLLMFINDFYQNRIAIHKSIELSSIIDDFNAIIPLFFLTIVFGWFYRLLTKKLFTTNFDENDISTLMRGNEADVVFGLGLISLVIGITLYTGFYYFIDSPVRLFL